MIGEWGYRIDDEPIAELVQSALPWRSAYIAAGPELPRQVTMYGRLHTESQGRTNSCVGHAGSSGAEYLRLLATGNEGQLSRWFSYLTAQKSSGFFGSDNGATIAGCIDALERFGICDEKLCPFTGRYSVEISQAAWDDARERRIGSHRHCRDLEDCLAHIGSGQGPLVCGYRWPSSFSRPGRGGVVGRWSQSGGAHATLATGYDQERELVECHNSHGEGYGDAGWFRVPFREWRKICRASSSAIFGISDLSVYRPRPVDFSKGFYA